MTLIEFKTTMNIAGIPEVKEGIYQIPSTDIQFAFNRHFCLVEGQIPLAVAEKIYDNYTENPYKVYIIPPAGKVTTSNDPRDTAISNKYMAFLKRRFYDMSAAAEVFLSEVTSKKKEMFYTDHDDMYIGKYKIYSKEGVIILITELINYFLTKNKKGIIIPSCFDENNTLGTDDISSYRFISECNDALIRNAKAYPNYEEWIKQHGLILDDGVNTKGQEIRQLLKSLAGTINPFINPDYDVVKAINYSDKVRLSIDSTNDRTDIRIVDIKTNDFVSNSIRSKGLSYFVSYHLNNDAVISLEYEFNEFRDNEYEEIVHVIYPGAIEFTYNLTDMTIKFDDQPKQPLRDVDIHHLMNELSCAISAAKKITIDNMCELQPQTNTKKIGEHPEIND